MSPALNGSSTLEHFEHSNASEIRNGIMFDFYLGLPHMEVEEPQKWGMPGNAFHVNDVWWMRGDLGGVSDQATHVH